jgi:hypothetical protein
MKKTLILTAILSSYSSLFATSIKHTGLDSTRSMNIEIKADGNVRTVGAGVGLLLVDGTDLLDVFCVNLFTAITVDHTYTANSIGAQAYDSDGGAAAWLMQTYLPVVNAATGLSRRIAGAALQLAIWDTIHDGGDGFSAGRIQATGHTNSSVLALANQWRLEALDEHGNANVFTAVPGTRVFQQQMYLPEGGEVPEPGTFAMLAVGGLGVLFGTWRRRRAAAK